MRLASIGRRVLVVVVMGLVTGLVPLPASSWAFDPARSQSRISKVVLEGQAAREFLRTRAQNQPVGLRNAIETSKLLRKATTAVVVVSVKRAPLPLPPNTLLATVWETLLGRQAVHARETDCEEFYPASAALDGRRSIIRAISLREGCEDIEEVEYYAALGEGEDDSLGTWWGIEIDTELYGTLWASMEVEIVTDPPEEDPNNPGYYYLPDFSQATSRKKAASSSQPGPPPESGDTFRGIPCSEYDAIVASILEDEFGPWETFKNALPIAFTTVAVCAGATVAWPAFIVCAGGAAFVLTLCANIVDVQLEMLHYGLDCLFNIFEGLTPAQDEAVVASAGVGVGATRFASVCPRVPRRVAA